MMRHAQQQLEQRVSDCALVRVPLPQVHAIVFRHRAAMLGQQRQALLELALCHICEVLSEFRLVQQLRFAHEAVAVAEGRFAQQIVNAQRELDVPRQIPRQLGAALERGDFRFERRATLQLGLQPRLQTANECLRNAKTPLKFKETSKTCSKDRAQTFECQ